MRIGAQRSGSSPLPLSGSSPGFVALGSAAARGSSEVDPYSRFTAFREGGEGDLRPSESGVPRLHGTRRGSGPRMTHRPFVVQVIGESGSGKTRVVERAVRYLVRRRLRVAVVKHSHHAPDLAGKDTHRFSKAGAEIVLFASDPSFALFRGDVARLVRALPVDVVLVEGYSGRRWGDLRLRVRSPRTVPALVARILEAAPRARGPPKVVVDGRRRSADPLWWLVANILEIRGAKEVRRAR